MSVEKNLIEHQTSMNVVWGNFLPQKKQAKVGRGTCVFFLSDQVIAESYGFPNLFELNTSETSKGALR